VESRGGMVVPIFLRVRETLMRPGEGRLVPTD
jgi:hypothetical protein